MSGSANSRSFGAAAYFRLKAKTRALVKACGGQEAAASLSRIVSHQAYGRYGRPHEAEFAPIDVIADLEADVGDPIVTRELAALAGFTLVPVPAAGADPGWIADLSATMRATGQTIDGIGEALADDGRVTPDEIDRLHLLDEVQKAQGALANLQALLRAVADGGRS